MYAPGYGYNIEDLVHQKNFMWILNFLQNTLVRLVDEHLKKRRYGEKSEREIQKVKQP